SRLLPKDKKIYGFYQDQDGSLWICAETAGVIRLLAPSQSKGAHQTKVYSGRDGLSQYVLATTEDKQGNTWFLTDIGVKIFDKNSRTFDFFRPEGFTLGLVTFLTRDDEY